MNWSVIPDEIEKQLRDMSKKKLSEAKKIILPSKHKYAYVLGRDKRETRKLRTLFEKRNKIFAYPSKRGI